MQNFVELIQNINSKVNSVVWGPPMLILMLLTGLYLTCGTRFFQIRRFCYTIKNTVAAIFKDRKVTKTKDEKAISQFQALATALAATVGTGNIVGVATAISSGGAGAVFWMWISALLGMMTSFSENALGTCWVCTTAAKMKKASGWAALCIILKKDSAKSGLRLYFLFFVCSHRSE